ncbi:Uncharacterised protein [Arachnia propionica]|uniref:Uncharacterized protein n=1 Tax=Arachnia propionica TaxID=1750 RepID=A0A448MUZ8_9ACTN|nr:Uncharacterised protein [Arachnia propionica]
MTPEKILYRIRHKIFHNLDRIFPHDITRHTRPTDAPPSRFSHAGRRPRRRRSGSHRIRRSRRTRRTNERNSVQCPNQLSRNHRGVRKTSNRNQPHPVLAPQKPPLNGIGVLLTKSRRRSIPPRLDTSNQPRLQRDPPPNQILLSSTMLHPLIPPILHVNIRTMHPNNLGRKITDTNPFLTTRFTITDKHEIRCPGNLPGRKNFPPIRHRNGHNIRSITLLPRYRRTRRHTIRRNTTTRQTKNHNNSGSYTPPEIKHNTHPYIRLLITSSP